jgi:hypothetical protein
VGEADSSAYEASRLEIMGFDGSARIVIGSARDAAFSHDAAIDKKISRSASDLADFAHSMHSAA